MKVTVNKDTCISCALCVRTCLDLFTLDENNKAVALVEVVPPQSAECAKAAELICPVDAITVE
ncbi:MAG TPA: ferredoxin [Desulfitobacteriaceae bacterium]|nr:ferredoxin [Desulfitobacteriaceae bacterium]